MSPTEVEILHQLSVRKEGKTTIVEMPQMPRETYEKVKALLLDMELKWSRKNADHRGTHPAEEVRRQLDLVIASGAFPDPNPHAYFPTPPDLAAELGVELRLSVDHRLGFHATTYRQSISRSRPLKLLEPHAGKGALIEAARAALEPDYELEISACEFEPRRHDKLRQQGVHMIGTDFLKVEGRGEYDLIFMNPPFSLDNDKNAWITHILHAYTHLAEEGVLISVIPASAKMYDNAIWKAVADPIYITTHGEEGRFKSSGTSIRTAMLEIHRDDQTWRSKPYGHYDNVYPSWYAFQAFIAANNDAENIWDRMEALGEEVLSGKVKLEEARKKVDAAYDAYLLKERRHGLNIRLSSRDRDYLFYNWRTRCLDSDEEWQLNEAEWTKLLKIEAAISGPKKSRHLTRPPGIPQAKQPEPEFPALPTPTQAVAAQMPELDFPELPDLDFPELPLPTAAPELPDLDFPELPLPTAAPELPDLDFPDLPVPAATAHQGETLPDLDFPDLPVLSINSLPQPTPEPLPVPQEKAQPTSATTRTRKASKGDKPKNSKPGSNMPSLF